MSLSEDKIEKFEKLQKEAAGIADSVLKALEELKLGPTDVAMLGLELADRGMRSGFSPEHHRLLLVILRHRLRGHQGAVMLCDDCDAWLTTIREFDGDGGDA